MNTTSKTTPTGCTGFQTFLQDNAQNEVTLTQVNTDFLATQAEFYTSGYYFTILHSLNITIFDAD